MRNKAPLSELKRGATHAPALAATSSASLKIPMTKQNHIYFPVDQPLTQEQMNHLTLQQLQNRDLNDPKYAAPFDCNFDWHKYITLDINRVMDAKKITQDVTKALDHIAATPEGQQSIRQAYAMRQHMRAVSGGPEKITINDDIATINETGSSTSPPHGTISINMGQATQSYRGNDGNYHPYSVEHILYHEIGHLKDGMNRPDNLAAYHKSPVAAEFARERVDLNASWKSVNLALKHTLLFGPEHDALLATRESVLSRYNAKKERVASIFEYPAMRETNQFIGHYFGEAPREMNHSGSTKGRSLLEAFGLSNPQGMDNDHVHLNPPITAICKPAAIVKAKSISRPITTRGFDAR